MSTRLSDLPAAFRAKAELLEPYAPAAATAFREAAELAEQALASSQLEALDLDAAAQESGYTEGHLRRLLGEGTVPNAGTEAKPLILRRDLPRKPGHGLARPRLRGASSRLQVAHAVVAEGR